MATPQSATALKQVCHPHSRNALAPEQGEGALQRSSTFLLQVDDSFPVDREATFGRKAPVDLGGHSGSCIGAPAAPRSTLPSPSRPACVRAWRRR